MVISLLVLSGCQDTMIYGYIEGDYVYIFPRSQWSVSRTGCSSWRCGETGQLLFSLEKQPRQAQLQAAKANVAQALAQLKDLQTGARPEKLQSIEGQIQQAQAQYARKQMHRNQKLVATHSIQQQALNWLIKTPMWP